jgi:glycosyltransferase involved in cell wall biosynthesis
VGRALRIGIWSPFFGATFGGGEKYLGVTAETVRDAFPRHRVDLIGAVPADVERYRAMLGLDLDGITVRATNPGAGGARRGLKNVRALRPLRDLALAAQAARVSRDYDLFLSMVYVIPSHSRARRTVILCQFPYPVDAASGPVSWRRRLLAGPMRAAMRRALGEDVTRAREVICQSQYVRGWVRRYWHRDAMVVNPPIDIPEAEPDLPAKRPLILSVGRFFTGGHAKRQDLLVRAFRELCDGGLTGWELHLAGAVHREGHNAGCFEEVSALARGYPVVLHPDVPGDELQDLYRRASIYWHASGFGVDPELRPIDAEHFGMTTAEAMGHGAVPVAIAAGGQPEVVRDGVDGYLWTELDQLRARTLELTAGAALRERLALAARESSRRFSRAAFRERMAAALEPVVRELEASG